jgi:hypothetical protein
MTDEPADEPAEHIAGQRGAGESAAERRRRRARVFGEVLPETTRDDRGDAWGEPDAGSGSSDEWLRRQVPPHHGR